MKISVVIQTYNSEQFLERVLNSVKEFDEIVVCDMYSTDRTIEIARKFDCKIVYHKKTDFCELRNITNFSAPYSMQNRFFSTMLRQYGLLSRHLSVHEFC